jgi:zinc transporter 9
LLKVGEVRGRRGPDLLHPFGRSQEKYFWALVSAVSVFFVGCGINVYHGVHALFNPAAVEPFSPLVVGLLLFSLALEAWTFSVALKEIGGWRKVHENRRNTTVVAVLLEDAVALLGIVLTLVVAGVSFIRGPSPLFDALVAIIVGVLLGAMAIFLAALNRTLLIDTSDVALDRDVEKWLAAQDIDAGVSSLILDDDRLVVLVSVARRVEDSLALGDSLKTYAQDKHGKRVDTVFWKIRTPAHSP